MAAAAARRVLHVGAEIYPLVKTGGLGDVLGALPTALAQLGADVRLLLPGYPAVLRALRESAPVATFGPAFGAASIVVWRGRLAGFDVPAYVIDAPALYDRPGNPYLGSDGQEWPDNPLRFGALGWIAAHLGMGDIDRSWRPEIVHGHDWHAGLACAHLAHHPMPGCRSVFTVHNLAFHGLFDKDLLPALFLPAASFVFDGLEFHGQGSAIKAGLQYADHITTVSPTYAREIQTHEFGCGLETVIAHRHSALSGILNGVDYAVWNTATDPLLEARFEADAAPDALRAGKAHAKEALQRQMGLDPARGRLLIGVVSRLTAQKGIDLLVEALPQVLPQHVQLALLGSGDARLESGLSELASLHPGSIAVRLGYDETLAHRIIAGADVIAVPSRFEPCGLTQLYGLRYGTLPLVRSVGGLADTVVDASDSAIAAGTATGFSFANATTNELLGAIRRAGELYRSPAVWLGVMMRAMAQDFSWNKAATEYREVYDQLLARSAR
ncbi:MAG TPA: glycogen synthase GlgA [Burkholderiaceae bacterium]|nr:glycogen synthase GlgA [Burkholderiaceae bacterium]